MFVRFCPQVAAIALPAVMKILPLQAKIAHKKNLTNFTAVSHTQTPISAPKKLRITN